MLNLIRQERISNEIKNAGGVVREDVDYWSGGANTVGSMIPTTEKNELDCSDKNL